MIIIIMCLNLVIIAGTDVIAFLQGYNVVIGALIGILQSTLIGFVSNAIATRINIIIKQIIYGVIVMVGAIVIVGIFLIGALVNKIVYNVINTSGVLAVINKMTINRYNVTAPN